MVDGHRQDDQSVVQDLGKDPEITDSASPYTGVVRGQPRPALARIIEVLEVRQHPALHSAVQLPELAIKLLGDLNVATGRSQLRLCFQGGGWPGPVACGLENFHLLVSRAGVLQVGQMLAGSSPNVAAIIIGITKHH